MTAARRVGQSSWTTVAPSAESGSWLVDEPVGARAPRGRPRGPRRCRGRGRRGPVGRPASAASSTNDAHRLARLLGAQPAHVELVGDVAAARRSRRTRTGGSGCSPAPRRAGRAGAARAGRAPASRRGRSPRRSPPSIRAIVPRTPSSGASTGSPAASGAVVASGSSSARSARSARAARLGGGAEPPVALALRAARRRASRAAPLLLAPARGADLVAERAAARRAPPRAPARGRDRAPPLLVRRRRARASISAAQLRLALARGAARAALGLPAPGAAALAAPRPPAARPPPPRRAARSVRGARGLDRGRGRRRRPQGRARAAPRSGAPARCRPADRDPVERRVRLRVEAGGRVRGAVGRARPLLQLGVVRRHDGQPRLPGEPGDERLRERRALVRVGAGGELVEEDERAPARGVEDRDDRAAGAPENVERLISIDCRSPMSASTRSKTGSAASRGRRPQAGLVEQRGEPERLQRDRLAARVRAADDERAQAAEVEVDRHGGVAVEQRVARARAAAPRSPTATAAPRQPRESVPHASARSSSADRLDERTRAPPARSADRVATSRAGCRSDLVALGARPPRRAGCSARRPRTARRRASRRSSRRRGRARGRGRGREAFTASTGRPPRWVTKCSCRCSASSRRAREPRELLGDPVPAGCAARAAAAGARRGARRAGRSRRPRPQRAIASRSAGERRVDRREPLARGAARARRRRRAPARRERRRRPSARPRASSAGASMPPRAARRRRAADVGGAARAPARRPRRGARPPRRSAPAGARPPRRPARARARRERGALRRRGRRREPLDDRRVLEDRERVGVHRPV